MENARGGARRRNDAFTLLELITVMLILAILIALGFVGYSQLRARARRAQCVANLRGLHVAAQNFVQQNGAWPQIHLSDYAAPEEFAQAWIDTLTPFGTTRASWICPQIQEQLQNPEYSTPQTARIDYMPMNFDDKPMTPHQWARQPWFVEVGDVHGSGNLMVFPDGSVSDLRSVAGQ